MYTLKTFIFLFTILSLILTIPVNAQTGTVTEIVTDASTKEPLIGANILIVELENIGGATDVEGKFLINAPVGSYSVRVSLIGYTPVVKTDVIVKTGSEVYLDIHLIQTTLELNEVQVTADYFDKAILENNLIRFH
ncbi:carboxypeptidase-like regulatory domain-containing protein [Bacteroidota bacterium]